LQFEQLDIARGEIASAVLDLQRRAYRIEAELIGSDEIPALRESLQSCRRRARPSSAPISTGSSLARSPGV
jgi:hypothetical protein